MILTLVCGLIVLLIIWDYLNKKHRYDILRKSKIAGPLTLPLIGSAYRLRAINSETMIDFLCQIVNNEGKIFRAWVLHQLVVFSANVKDLEVLLSSTTLITKNNVYDMLSLWLGDGLLMSTDKKWHTRRKIITPTFHFKILEQFVSIFDQQSSIMIGKLETKADGKTVVDIFPAVCLMALDIITETAMGVKVNAQMNSEMEYVKAVKIVTEIISKRLRRPTWRTDWLFRLTAPRTYNYMMHHIDIMQNFTKGVIEKRRATLLNDDTKLTEITNEIQDIGSKRRLALLDVLLQATVDGRPLSNEDIREEVETFMFAGHDTTTSGVSFALYVIARHANVQQRIFEEIREVIGDDKEHAVTYRELQELKYLECVIKESLRLYPPVPIIGRYFSEDVQLDDKIIPANTHFNIPLIAVLRDPDNFKEPNEFKPERFFTENIVDIYPFAYVPFSAGSRNCIGQKFAMLEMKSTISKVLRYYELLPLGPEVIPTLSLVLRSKNGMNMGLKPREYVKKKD